MYRPSEEVPQWYIRTTEFIDFAGLASGPCDQNAMAADKGKGKTLRAMRTAKQIARRGAVLAFKLKTVRTPSGQVARGGSNESEDPPSTAPSENFTL